MQGWFFIPVLEGGQVIETGKIVKEVGADRYLCQFVPIAGAAGIPVARVVPVEAMENWRLFPNQKDATTWLQSQMSQGEGDGEGDGDGDKKPAAKKPARKRPASKKTPAKKTPPEESPGKGEGEGGEDFLE